MKEKTSDLFNQLFIILNDAGFIYNLLLMYINFEISLYFKHNIY